MGRNRGNVTYELELIIDTLEKDDIELKVFLIKDYRNFNSKVDQFEVFSVPRSTATAGIFADFFEILHFSGNFKLAQIDGIFSPEFSVIFPQFFFEKAKHYREFLVNYFAIFKATLISQVFPKKAKKKSEISSHFFRDFFRNLIFPIF